jgi:hypothetical protein
VGAVRRGVRVVLGPGLPGRVSKGVVVMLPVSRAVVGAGHVTACVVLGVVFVSTGAWLPLLLSCTAGCFAWWLLRDD